MKVIEQSTAVEILTSHSDSQDDNRTRKTTWNIPVTILNCWNNLPPGHVSGNNIHHLQLVMKANTGPKKRKFKLDAQPRSSK